MKYKDIENEEIRKCCRQIIYIAKTQKYTPKNINRVIQNYTDTTTVHGYNLWKYGITAEVIKEYLYNLDVYIKWAEKFK